jgi:hypothetical protein
VTLEIPEAWLRQQPALLRVTWVPGSDELRGECHCGAEHITQDPVDVWDWLLGHMHAEPA